MLGQYLEVVHDHFLSDLNVLNIHDHLPISLNTIHHLQLKVFFFLNRKTQSIII
jgi:hypothetical protein